MIYEEEDDAAMRPRGRRVGANARNIDYQSMNSPYDRRGKENPRYSTQNRLPKLMGDFGGPVQSRRGHVGQSLIDYQVKPRIRGRRPDNEIMDVDYDQDFGPIYDDRPHFEQY